MDRVVTALLLGSVASPAFLRAQELATREPFRPAVICAQTDSLHLARVRRDPPAGGDDLGPVLHCSGEGLTLGAFAGQPGPRFIDATTIRRLWVRRGSGFAGAIWGAIGGALLGYAIASAPTHLCPPPSGPAPSTGCRGSVSTGLAVGAVAGAGIGWFFGRGLPRWKPIYRAGS